MSFFEWAIAIVLVGGLAVICLPWLRDEMKWREFDTYQREIDRLANQRLARIDHVERLVRLFGEDDPRVVEAFAELRAGEPEFTRRVGELHASCKKLGIKDVCGYS